VAQGVAFPDRRRGSGPDAHFCLGGYSATHNKPRGVFKTIAHGYYAGKKPKTRIMVVPPDAAQRLFGGARKGLDTKSRKQPHAK